MPSCGTTRAGAFPPHAPWTKVSPWTDRRAFAPFGNQSGVSAPATTKALFTLGA